MLCQCMESVKQLKKIVEEAYRDSMVFPEFGGVTFSGGECLLQAKNIKKNMQKF